MSRSATVLNQSQGGGKKAASEEDVAAEMKDGVLTIKIKKTEEAKPRRIEIQ